MAMSVVQQVISLKITQTLSLFAVYAMFSFKPHSLAFKLKISAQMISLRALVSTDNLSIGIEFVFGSFSLGHARTAHSTSHRRLKEDFY